METIEYRVRPVTRYIVTEYKEDGRAASCGTLLECESLQAANGIAEALAARHPVAKFTPLGSVRLAQAESPTDIGGGSSD